MAKQIVNADSVLGTVSDRDAFGEKFYIVFLVLYINAAFLELVSTGRLGSRPGKKLLHYN